MRKFPQPDGRGIVPRKWSTLKECGPLVLLCERILKKMIQFGWPSRYETEATNRLFPTVARWFHLDGVDTPEFRKALAYAVEIVSASARVLVAFDGDRLSLCGEYNVDVISGRIVAGHVVFYKDESGRVKRKVSDVPF